MRGEPIGPQHRAGLIAMLGDPRVGATLGGVASPAGRRRADRADDRDWVAITASGSTPRSTARPARSSRAAARSGPSSAAATRSRSAGPSYPDRWGQGLATELGAASVAHAFGPLGLADVVSFTLIENRASRRVMEKLGFAYEDEIEHAGLPHVLYRLSAASARSTSSSVV